jgi:hypothetical protein
MLREELERTPCMKYDFAAFDVNGERLNRALSRASNHAKKYHAKRNEIEDTN